MLAEVAHRQSGHTPDKNVPEYWDGGVKWISLTDCDRLNRVYISDTSKKISEEGVANSSARILRTGVVVLSRDAGVGQSAITTCPMAVSQHFLAWECSDRLEPRFLYYWFQFLRPELERIAAGSTIKTIGLQYFERMRVPLPPLVSQGAISNALYALDLMTFEVNKLVSAKETRKRGLMQKMLNGHVRFPEFFGPPLDTRPLAALCEEVSDRNGDRLGHDSVMGVIKGVGFQPMRDRVRGKGGLERYKVVPSGAFAFNPMRLNIGSIAHNKLGRSVLVSPDYVVFRARPEKACAEFINQLRYSTLWSSFMKRAGAGSVRVRIYFNDLARMRVPAPDLGEQRRIAILLDTMDREIELLEALSKKFDHYKSGLLSRFLSGELQGQHEPHP